MRYQKGTDSEVMINVLFEQYKNQLYLFAFRLSGDADQAKDIVQETFLKIYKYIKKGLIIKSPKSLIFKTAYNLFIDKKRTIKKYNEKINELGYIGDNGSGPEEIYLKKEKIDQIHKGIEGLKKQERAILFLYSENFSYMEMGEVLRINSNSVGKVLSRSIGKLQKVIKDGELK